MRKIDSRMAEHRPKDAQISHDSDSRTKTAARRPGTRSAPSESCHALEVGDDSEVLLDTAHTPLPSRDKLSARWMGPFKIFAKIAPITYRLAVPAAWRAFNQFNLERLRRYLRRPLAGEGATLTKYPR